MVPLALLAAAAAQQAPALGSHLTIRGQLYVPQVVLELDQPYAPIPGLYRRVELDWRARPLQTGPYPAAAFAARREGNVGVRLVIDAAGRLAGCTTMRPSGEASLDRHACPYLMRNALFHPALDSEGRRIPRTLDATLSYRLLPVMHVPSITRYDGPPMPRPLQPIDAAALGVNAGTRRPPHVDGVTGILAVSPEGAASACTLVIPTYDDALDRQICDRARAMRFEPQRGRAQRAEFYFYFRWPGGGH
jgi:TonB family protein